MSVLAERGFVRSIQSRARRIGYCAAPEGRPVHPGIRAALETVANTLSDLGHSVEEADLDLSGWDDTFGSLVLAEEWRERGHLMDYCGDEMTDYEIASLAAAGGLSIEQVAAARRHHGVYRDRIAGFFSRFDMLLTPTTASPAFTIGERPTEIDGRRVSRLWGAFPFTCPFNVAGTPAAAIPCGMADALPVSAQLVAAHGRDADLLDLTEDLEEALGFHVSAATTAPGPELSHG